MAENNKYPEHGEIILYEAEDVSSAIDVHLKDETVWLSLKQIAELFGRDKSVVSRHLKNIFTTGELAKEAVVAKSATTASDGKTYQVEYFNLDAIISVGYRVNSKRGAQFRIWATKVLKEHFVQGFSVNQKRLAEKGVTELQQTLDLLSETLRTHKLISEEGRAVLDIVNNYARTWQLLLQYDEDNLPVPQKRHDVKTILGQEDAISAILSLKKELLAKGEATEIFGQERGDSLAGIIGAIYQTFDGQDLYPGVEEKAAHLLYFVIKDHPFTDGNKRIGTFLFLLFLKINGLLDELSFNNNTLVALTLLTATSDPAQKDLMVRLIINLLDTKG